MRLLGEVFCALLQNAALPLGAPKLLPGLGLRNGKDASVSTRVYTQLERRPRKLVGLVWSFGGRLSSFGVHHNYEQ